MSFLSRKKPKIIVVLGQTSTGKSDLAVDIAKHFHGEVISADSRQVYRGMDLGSGKITEKEMQGIPHHLLDVANPQENFSVQEFQELGTKAIEDILSRRKIPIVCGGTGFYIDSLIYQTQFPNVAPNEKLREKLGKKSLKELQEMYRKKTSSLFFKIKSFFYNTLPSLLEKNKKQEIDIQNPVRIIRAIEIINALGYIPQTKQKEVYNTLFIGLELPKETLKKRIYTRIIKRLEEGMLNEAKRLLEQGISHKRLQSFGLEYRYMSKYLLNELSYEEMIEELYRATLQFAKRQKTWFKRNKNIHWFHPLSEKRFIFEKIRDFLTGEY